MIAFLLLLLAVPAAGVCHQGSSMLLPRRPGDVATYQLELDITDGSLAVSENQPRPRPSKTKQRGKGRHTKTVT